MERINDDFMREMLARSKSYTVVFLKAGPNRNDPSVDALVWEHGRRNFALRADGVLSIVCPITDDSEWRGVGIFNATADEVVRIMDDDPGVKAGLFTYEVHPVRSFPGDTHPARDRYPTGSPNAVQSGFSHTKRVSSTFAVSAGRAVTPHAGQIGARSTSASSQSLML
jgi:hypothetical protein